METRKAEKTRWVEWAHLSHVQKKKREPRCIVRGKCKLVQSLLKTVWRFLKKLKIELPYDPAVPLMGIYPKKMKTLIQKDICTPVFITTLLTIAKI